MKYLKSISYNNLILISAGQLIIKYLLFQPFDIAITLSNFGFVLLVLSTLCLSAGYDIITALQKKDFSISVKEEKTGYNLFIALNVVSVLIGFYLSNIIGNPGLLAIFIIASALIYLQSSVLKNYLLVRNITIAFLVAMIIIITGIYDLMPAITPQNQTSQTTVFSILTDYSIFIFLISLLYSFVEEQTTVDDDYKNEYKTLSLLLGKSRTNKAIFTFTILPIAALVYYLYTYLYHQLTMVLYVLLLLILPLLLIMVFIWKAKYKQHYTTILVILKLVILFTIVSLGLHHFMYMN